MKTRNRIICSILFLLLLFSFSITTFAYNIGGGSFGEPESKTYSSVLFDLQKDSKFDASNYPYLTLDYFQSINNDTDKTNDVDYISVIQIGESTDKELFIYTYQPLEYVSEICASSINISVGLNSSDYKKYDLTLVSSEGVFKKYLVKNLVVSNTSERFYNISEIERPFNTFLDEQINNETIIDFKAHTVAQTWCCYYQNGDLVYEMEHLDVVEITPTLTDFIYLEDGFTLGNLINIKTASYAHYIAFNVENFNVDKIIDASITYKIIDTRYSETIFYTLNFESSRLSGTTYKNKNGEWVENPSSDDWSTIHYEISDDQIMSYKGKGLLGKKYTWDRIMSSSKFVNTVESQDCVWSPSAKETLLNSQFVFSFTETPVTIYDPVATYSDDCLWKLSDFYSRDGKKVAQVDILRLHFMSEGKTYNLGVVADTTTSDDTPGASGLGLADLDAYFEDFLSFIMLALFVIIFLVLLVYIKPVASMIGKGFGEIFGLIWSVITLPFQLIASLFDSKRR